MLVHGLCLALAPRALAQANYEGALIGGRSALMGGTGVANGSDAAAPLQNPATIVSVEGTSFVFSTFFLQATGRSLGVDRDLVAEVDRGAASLDQTQVRVLPNSTCLFFDLRKVPGQAQGHHKASICIAEPEAQSFELGTSVLGESTAGRSGFQQRFVSQVFSKKVYALGWAVALSDRVSIGVNPMLEEVGFRDTEGVASVLAESNLEDAVGSPGKSTSNVLVRRASSYAGSLLVGARWRVGSGFALGASLQSPSLHFWGNYSASRSLEATTSSAEQYAQDKGSMRFDYPLRVALGLSGHVGKVRFEVDGYFHGGRGDFAAVDAKRSMVNLDGGVIEEAATTDLAIREGVRPVANLSLGVEVPVRPTWSIVAGVLTDFGGLRPRQGRSLVDDTLFRSRLDAVHGSVGVAWTPPAGSVLLGLRGFYGQGEFAVTDPRTLPPTWIASPQSQWGLALVISGQLTLEMIATADPTGLVKKATGAAPNKE